MNKHTFTQSRRKFLKGAAYSTALSLGGLSSIAFAASKPVSITNSDISVMQQTMLDGESVTLINHSDKLVKVDAYQPISLEQVNGSLVVKVNQNESEAINGMFVVSPGERISFDINTKRSGIAENKLQITSDNPVFNRVVPVHFA